MEDKIDLNVISRPVSVGFQCSNCGESVSYEYDEFITLMGEPCDWQDKLVQCIECGVNFEIYHVEWL